MYNKKTKGIGESLLPRFNTSNMICEYYDTKKNLYNIPGPGCVLDHSNNKNIPALQNVTFDIA